MPTSILVIEDGTMVTDANSYISSAFADTWHANHGNVAWAAIATQDLKEQAILRAMNILESKYLGVWKGWRYNVTQALSWPRIYVQRVDTPQNFPMYWPPSVLPTILLNTVAELALRANEYELVPDLERRVDTEKLAGMEIDYNKFTPQTKRYPLIDLMLAPLLTYVPSSGHVRLVRL